MTQSEINERLHLCGICCIVPTYNNEGSILTVLRGLMPYCSDIIVVDDGCTDNTSSLLEELTNITIVHHAHNMGKGAALRTGFRKAIEEGFRYAITLDADGQHYPEDVEEFLKANIAHPNALIVGERNLKGVERSGGSTFANHFANFWFAVQTGQHLADTQTGFRLYPLHHLVGLSHLTSRYEAELELLVWASWAGVQIVSTPIRVYYPPREERVSHFRPFYDFGRITVFNTLFTLLAVIVGWPIKLARILCRALRSLYALLFFLISALLVFMPWSTLFALRGRVSAEQSARLRRVINGFARFVMVKHGVPGVKFSCVYSSRKLFSSSPEKQEIVDNGKLVWNTPHLVVCNHQSWLDLMCLLQLTPRLVVITNEWVWHNPFFGRLIQQAEYLPASMGMEELLPKLESLVKRGYSIAVFPEGTRSFSAKLGRFHKGALTMAQELKLDVLPLCLTGASHALGKKQYYLRSGHIRLEIAAPLNQQELSELGSIKAQNSALHKAYTKWLDQTPC